MANFVRLTFQDDSAIWLNMDLVEQFHQTDGGTALHFVPTASDDNTVTYVKESPETIMEELFFARRNHGYGFGETE